MSFYFREHDNFCYPLDKANMKWEYEDDFQIELLNVLYSYTPKEVEFHFSLGASFSPISGQKNKRMGYHSGWPDIQAGWPDCNRMFFLELKSETGTLRKSQKECHTWIRLCGGKVETVKTIADSIKILHFWGCPFIVKNNVDLFFV